LPGFAHTKLVDTVQAQICFFFNIPLLAMGLSHLPVYYSIFKEEFISNSFVFHILARKMCYNLTFTLI